MVTSHTVAPYDRAAGLYGTEPRRSPASRPARAGDPLLGRALRSDRRRSAKRQRAVAALAVSVAMLGLFAGCGAEEAELGSGSTAPPSPVLSTPSSPPPTCTAMGCSSQVVVDLLGLPGGFDQQATVCIDSVCTKPEFVAGATLGERLPGEPLPDTWTSGGRPIVDRARPRQPRHAGAGHGARQRRQGGARWCDHRTVDRSPAERSQLPTDVLVRAGGLRPSHRSTDRSRRRRPRGHDSVNPCPQLTRNKARRACIDLCRATTAVGPGCATAAGGATPGERCPGPSFRTRHTRQERTPSGTVGSSCSAHVLSIPIGTASRPRSPAPRSRAGGLLPRRGGP